MTDWKSLTRLNRGSKVPLYYQIVQILAGLVESGELRSGDALPPETEMASLFGVSRLTIRQALEELEQTKTIYRLHGVGTFVAETPKTTITPSKLSFTEKMSSMGKQVRNQLISLKVEAASEETAANLGIPAGSEVVEVVRLRCADDNPIMVEHAFLPVSLFPDLADAFPQEGSLYEFLKYHYHIHITASDQTFQPVHLNAKQAELLSVQPNSLGMLSKIVAYSQNDQPIEFSWSVIRGDKCTFYFRFREEGEAALATGANQ